MVRGHGSALRLVGWQRQARVDRCLGPSLISSAVDLVWQTDVQVIAASRPTWGDRVPVPVQLTVSWSIRGDRIADLVAPYCVAIAADRSGGASALLDSRVRKVACLKYAKTYLLDDRVGWRCNRLAPRDLYRP